MITFAFWAACALLVYAYAGYAALAIVGGALRRRTVRKRPIEPAVSILIAAHNEADVIGASVRNKLDQRYPAAKLEVIVVSDASQDATDAIVAAIPDRRVRLIRQPARGGKTAALNRAVAAATGEVIVFADANSMYDGDAVRRLVSNFNDEAVGYVTGRLIYGARESAGVSLGCAIYMRYENLLRQAETALGSVVGVNGGIDAMRRELYQAMRADQLPDFVLPLGVVRRGFRAVYEPGAIAREEALTTSRAEYRMRVRVTLRAWWTLVEMRDLLNPARHGVFAVQLASHKVLRYLSFVAPLVAFAAAAALWHDGGVYRAASVCGSGFAALAAFGATGLTHGRVGRLAAAAWYVVLVNVASAHALFAVCRGQRLTVWTPRLG